MYWLFPLIYSIKFNLLLIPLSLSLSLSHTYTHTMSLLLFHCLVCCMCMCCTILDTIYILYLTPLCPPPPSPKFEILELSSHSLKNQTWGSERLNFLPDIFKINSQMRNDSWWVISIKKIFHLIFFFLNSLFNPSCCGGQMKKVWTMFTFTLAKAQKNKLLWHPELRF